MNVSKTLAAAVTATAIVAVGFGCAQTPKDTPVAVIAPAETQKAAALDPSMQAPVEGSQGTQSGPAPASVTTASVTPTPVTPTPVTPTPAPPTSDKAMASELPIKVDRN